MKSATGQAQSDQGPQPDAAGVGDGAHAQAKHLILKVLGARRVSGWCKVAELTVYQWLQRGDDAQPIPMKHVPAIVAGARADGLEAPIAVLCPAMADAADA